MQQSRLGRRIGILGKGRPTEQERCHIDHERQPGRHFAPPGLPRGIRDHVRDRDFNYANPIRTYFLLY